MIARFILRIAYCLAALVATSLLGAPLAAKEPTNVLFICQFGTVKSPIARELLLRRASARKISVTAAARGITPEEHLSASLRAQLDADRINPSREPLRPLARKDIDRADIVIAFDPLPAAYRSAKVVSWGDVPSMNLSYSAARAALDTKIDALLDRIGRRQ